MHDLDEFTRAYVTCALWSSHDESDESGGEPMDANYDVDDFAPETLARMIEDCAWFQTLCADDINVCCLHFSPEYGDVERAGHDFWLTRNGHGAGFWDGRWSEPGATRLDEWSRVFGESTLYAGDDGKIYTFEG